MAETKTYLDYSGLQLFYNNLAKNYASKLDVDKLIQQKTFDEWLSISDKVLAAGTILVYTDRTSVNGEYIPDIKIADGKTSVANLPFLVERNLDSLIEKYTKIVDDVQNEIYLLGAAQGSDAIKRNTGIKMQGSMITADIFDGMARKVEHSLTIGENKFDGSADVVVPVYKGNME